MCIHICSERESAEEEYVSFFASFHDFTLKVFLGISLDHFHSVVRKINHVSFLLLNSEKMTAL